MPRMKHYPVIAMVRWHVPSRTEFRAAIITSDVPLKADGFSSELAAAKFIVEYCGPMFSVPLITRLGAKEQYQRTCHELVHLTELWLARERTLLPHKERRRCAKKHILIAITVPTLNVEPIAKKTA